MLLLFVKELFISAVLPMAVETVKSYVKSSDSKKDDKVLDIVQIGAGYLADKNSNTLSKNLAEKISTSSMLKVQKAR